jgi:hopanoid biosynthesis associated protein HpnK
MVGARAAAEAVVIAKAQPSLKVGLHLVLTDGRPLTAAPHLTTKDGEFPANMVATGARMFFSPSARKELAAEIEAQFAAFAATGLALDHVNAHKHFHLHPTIAGLILKIGPRHGAKAVRLPIEPRGVVRALEADAAALPVTDAMARLARRRFRRAGWLAPDQVFGLRWSGAMTAARLTGVLGALPQGLSEVYLHPAASDAFAGAVRGYDYEGELAALTGPDVRRALAASGTRTGGFADFQA